MSDLSKLDAEAQTMRLDCLFQELSKLPFDLVHGPMMHVWLIALSPTRHELLVALPALCADTSTFCQLVDELATAYRAVLNGHDIPVSEAPQYADLAEWQLELLASDDAKAGAEFWRQHTAGTTMSGRLPFERAANTEAAFSPASLFWRFELGTTARIDEVRSQYEATTAAFFLACWQALLSRLTAWPELTVGVGCHGRTYEELKGAVGLLTRYLPIRGDFERDLKFSELVRQASDSLVTGFDRQEYFSWDALAAPTDTSARFLPFGFDFETIPGTWSVSEHLTLSLDRVYHCIEPFKAKLSVERRGASLEAALHYDANRMEVVEIERLRNRLETLINSVCENPDATVEELNILSGAEQRQLLIEFNNTKVDYRTDKRVFQLIEEQAAIVPDNIAVILGTEQLTYRQLNNRANQLAHRLQTLGVRRGVLVGLYLEQSVDTVVALLGILKAGGAYVPLDAEYPKERIGLILQDTHAPVLLTQRRLLTGLPEQYGDVVCIDGDWDSISRESEQNPNAHVAPEDFAYVIYTSGSTGLPKGVVITHQNLVHSTLARKDYYHEPVERYLLLSSFAFDSSVAGIFWALCDGGALVLVPAGVQRDPVQVADIIARDRVSHILCLPSLYALLLSEADRQKLLSLRTTIVAGEACPTELVRTHQKAVAHATLFNEYGPTEGTVWSTVYNCQFHRPGTPVPIGRPIGNVQIYLLNSRLQPVPIGVPGELYIGGGGVAKGYLNRPELTAEKFIRNPFEASPAASAGEEQRARLYKTGDLARYLPDGNIEFLGRVDQQIKIRGYRIEPGEIEALLGQHSGIREAVVAAREDTPGEKRLVAYLVAANGLPPAVDEMREFIGRRLPDFMIPSTFVFLDALPLNPNGKVDRRALPEPSRARPELAKTYVAPRTVVEQALTRVWAEVLDIERVGVHDNFFDLGGHSILVTRLVGLLRDQLHADVALRAIFETPTVAGLCETLVKNPDGWARLEKAAQLFVQLDDLSEDELDEMLKERNLEPERR